MTDLMKQYVLVTILCTRDLDIGVLQFTLITFGNVQMSMRESAHQTHQRLFHLKVIVEVDTLETCDSPVKKATLGLKETNVGRVLMQQ